MNLKKIALVALAAFFECTGNAAREAKAECWQSDWSTTVFSTGLSVDVIDRGSGFVSF